MIPDVRTRPRRPTGPSRREDRVGTAKFGWARPLAVMLAVVVVGIVAIRDARPRHDVASPAPPAATGSTLTVGTDVRGIVGDHPEPDAAGQVWQPSSGFAGGRVVTSGAPVSGTASPLIYQSYREGVSSFSTDVPGPGTYAVSLSFVERSATGPGQRVFDVVAGSVPIATGVDLFARVGANQADHVLAPVTVTGSRLTIDFRSRKGLPIVSAVEIAFLGPQLEPQPVWQDDFDGPAGATIDPAHWQVETGGGGWGNGELQTYTDKADNVRLDGAGHLVIEARRELGGDGRAIFTSGRVTTQDRATFQYGRIVIRAQLPGGRGLWPAGWALGTDIDTVGFPRSGEIDVFESTGDPASVSGHLHGPGPDGTTSSIGSGVATAPVDSFVDYGVSWTPLGVSFDVDGQTYFTATKDDVGPATDWVFDKPFYLVLDLAVGGSLIGPPDSSTLLPAQLLVDQVRVSSW